MTQLDLPTPHDRIERSLMEDPVSALKPRKPVTVLSTTRVGDAIQMMLANNFGALLVVDGAGRLMGIFSERDLLRKVAGLHADYATQPVSRFMTAKPETVTATDTLAFVAHKMDVGGYRHLPVLENGRPVGVISVRDMLRHITRLCRDQ
jgi:CBS domain-containing protein